MNNKKVLNSIIKKSNYIKQTDYFEKKGYSEEIIKKFNLGFLPNGLLEYSSAIKEDKAILACYKYVIPQYFKNGNIDYIIFRKDTLIEEKLKIPFKIKKNFILGNKNKLWNYQYLYSLEENFYIFITENWTDALSVEEIGYRAISLNGVDNIKEFWKIIKELNISKNGKFILICDNDFYGKRTNIFLKNILESLNIKALIYDKFPANIKDCNEWLQEDKKIFKKNIKNFLIENNCLNIKNN